MQILLCFSFKNTDEKAIKIFKWMDTSKDPDLTIFKGLLPDTYSLLNMRISLPLKKKLLSGLPA